MWPQVEEKLGYGIVKRRVRYLLYDQGAVQSKPLVFLLPEWWAIHGFQEAAEVVHDRRERTGNLVYRDAKVRRNAGWVIRKGSTTVIDATIDGVEVGIPEAVRYALTWQEMLPKSGRAKPKNS